MPGPYPTLPAQPSGKKRKTSTKRGEEKPSSNLGTARAANPLVKALDRAVSNYKRTRKERSEGVISTAIARKRLGLKGVEEKKP